MYLQYFWEVGTSEFTRFSNQNSSKFVHAIQASFCALQITDNMEKWPKMVARGGPKIHQQSWKVNPGTLQDSSVCIFTQLDHQNGSQGPPNDRKLSSGDSKSGVYPEIVRGSFVREYICWLRACRSAIWGVIQIESLQNLHIFKSFAHLRLQSQGRPAAGAEPWESAHTPQG